MLIAALVVALLFILVAIGVILTARNSSVDAYQAGESFEAGASAVASGFTSRATSFPLSAEFIAGENGTEPTTLSVGDTFLGMKLVYLEIADRDTGERTVNATFTGEVVLRGELVFDDGTSPESSSGYLFLSLDEDSVAKVPRSRVNIEEYGVGIPYSLSFSNDTTLEEIRQLTGLRYSDGVPCEVVVHSIYNWCTPASDATDFAYVTSITLL